MAVIPMVSIRKYIRISSLCLFFIFHAPDAVAQFLMDMVDTTKDMGKGMLSVVRRYENLRVGGYIQTQYQTASSAGAAGYSGGNFSEFSNNRFMIRRGRIRFDYALHHKSGDPQLQFVFQFDGSERGVFIRDFWGRFWERKWHLLSFTSGMFARPFGYEVNLSSSDREAPERGRMSQILLKTERDLGVMASIEPVRQQGFVKHLKVDLGLFNGQGLSGPLEFDGYKDLIGQAVLKPVKLTEDLQLGGGVSFLWGGMRQFAGSAYRLHEKSPGSFRFEADSVSSRIGDKLPRRYMGVNGQLKWAHGWGNTEFRAEYWRGTQTSTQNSTETPGTPVLLADGTFAPNYIRQFEGVFLVFLQHIGTERHQIGLKWDSYDPNRSVSGRHIGAKGSNLNAADLKYATLGAGYIHYLNPNLKLTVWYDLVRNENTLMQGLEKDLSDNVLTVRAQFRF